MIDDEHSIPISAKLGPQDSFATGTSPPHVEPKRTSLLAKGGCWERRLFDVVIRRFAGDDHVVHMTLPQSGAGDSDKA